MYVCFHNINISFTILYKWIVGDTSFVGDDGKPCEFNCEKEWINDTNNLKIGKDRQKSPQSDHFLGTIVKF